MDPHVAESGGFTERLRMISPDSLWHWLEPGRGPPYYTYCFKFGLQLVSSCHTCNGGRRIESTPMSHDDKQYLQSMHSNGS